MYYSYKCLDNNGKNVHIGITNKLSRRKQEHKNNSEWYNENLIYQFIKMPNKYMTEICENYLINKYKPRGNKAIYYIDVNLISLNLNQEWTTFKEVKRSSKVKDIDMLEKRRKDIKKEQNLLNIILDNYVDKIQKIYINEYQKICVRFYSEEARNLILSKVNPGAGIVSIHGNIYDKGYI